MSQSIDLDRMEATGEAVAIAGDVGATTTGYAAFSVASNGTLIYSPHIGMPGQLRWFDRGGNQVGSVGDAAEYLDVELSPDDQAVAASRVDDPGLTGSDIWIIDLVRGVPTRMTTDRGQDAGPQWSPNGQEILFRSNRTGYTQLYRMPSSGAQPERSVLNTGANLLGGDWSRDGKLVLYSTASGGGFDIWAWPADGSSKPERAIHTALNAMHGRLSPNGRWLAYASDESGQLQVYVKPYPGADDKRTQISADGGAEPRWRRDGNELFYLATSGKLMSVAIPGGNPLAAGVPKALFDVRVPLAGNPYRTNYAVTTDGRRFLVNTRVQDAVTPINIIFNWTALLKK